MPGAPSSFLLLVVRPGALSSVLAPTIYLMVSNALAFRLSDMLRVLRVQLSVSLLWHTGSTLLAHETIGV